MYDDIVEAFRKEYEKERFKTNIPPIVKKYVIQICERYRTKYDREWRLQTIIKQLELGKTKSLSNVARYDSLIIPDTLRELGPYRTLGAGCLGRITFLNEDGIWLYKCKTKNCPCESNQRLKHRRKLKVGLTKIFNIVKLEHLPTNIREDLYNLLGQKEKEHLWYKSCSAELTDRVFGYREALRLICENII